MQEKKSQIDLTVLDEQFQQLLEGICEVAYSVLPLERPKIIFVADSVKTLTGYSSDEILADGQLWLDIVHPADQDRVFSALTCCKNSGAGFEIEYRIIHKDGSLRYVVNEGEPVFDDQGQITQIEGIMTDISEGKKL